MRDNEAADGVIATVGNVVLANEAGWEGVLTADHIADIGTPAQLPIETEASNAFPLDFNIGEYAACASPLLVKFGGGDNVAVVDEDVPSSLVIGSTTMPTAAKNEGLNFLGHVDIPIVETDMSAVVQQVANLGNVNIVALPLAGSELDSFMETSQQLGKNWIFCINGGQANLGALAQLGPSLTDLYVAEDNPPLTAAAQYPWIRQFENQMTFEAAHGDPYANLAYTNYNVNAMKAWLGMQVVKAVTATMKGPITATTFLAAISHDKNVNIGLEHPLNFTHSYGIAPYNRVFRDDLYIEKWSPDEDQLVLAEPKPVSGLKAFFGSAVKLPKGFV